MAEYIERKEIFRIWSEMPEPTSLTSLANAIYKTPVADVVHVVRCGECKYGYRLKYLSDCVVCEDDNCRLQPEYGFCHRGERKEGAH